jgi:ABC-type transport system substrate-binding protein
MKKIILVGLAILAVSTSGALAAKKATKPKAPAAAATTTTTTTTNPGGAAPFMLGQVSASDRELYEKSQRESGMKK